MQLVAKLVRVAIEVPAFYDIYGDKNVSLLLGNPWVIS